MLYVLIDPSNKTVFVICQKPKKNVKGFQPRGADTDRIAVQYLLSLRSGLSAGLCLLKQSLQ